MAKTAVAVTRVAAKHVTSAAGAVARFTEAHAAQIGGIATGVAVFAGCEALTAGAGTVGCAALSGAAASAVSYAVSSAQQGNFSWSGLGESALTGAAGGLAGGALGEVLGSAAGSFSGQVSSVLSEGAADEAAPAVSSGEGEAGAAVPAGDPGADPAADETSSPGSCPTAGGESFAAGTLVLLASGKLVPISSLKPGTAVRASDTKTGKDQAETVTAVLVHRDTDLYDLTVKTRAGTEVIHTTSNHLFWNPYLHYWVNANKLSRGEHLKTANGAVAVADGGTVPADHDGWMWDLTVPGNNDHDFYVLANTSEQETGSHRTNYVEAGATSILVHNCDGIGYGPAPENAQRVLDRVDSKGSPLQGYKGGSTFGNTGSGGGQVLPEFDSSGNPVTYREWDVNPNIKGVDRGPQRLVTGSDGSAYYTSDHYATFIQVR